MIKTDLKSRSTEDGGKIDQVNPEGYVPALMLNDGSLLTENTAILSFAQMALPSSNE